MICLLLWFFTVSLYVPAELQPWFTAGLFWLSLFNILRCVAPQLDFFFFSVVEAANWNSHFLLCSAFKHLLLRSVWMLLSKLHHIKEICSKKSDFSQQEMQFSKTSSIGDAYIQLCIMTIWFLAAGVSQSYKQSQGFLKLENMQSILCLRYI